MCFIHELRNKRDRLNSLFSVKNMHPPYDYLFVSVRFDSHGITGIGMSSIIRI